MANSVAHELPAFEPAVFLSTAAAKHRDHRLALLAVSLSLLLFIAAVPFVRLPLPEVWAFIPAYESALTISDLTTAVLLFAQFSILRSRALLVLGCGYLFTALIAVAHMLTFPDLFSPAGMLGAGPQSTAWLYMFWHGGFPIAVVAYALVKGDTRAASLQRRSARLAALSSIVSVVAAVVALTSLATIGHALLPNIMQGNAYTPIMIFVVSTVLIFSVVAVVVLWARRPHTVLDLWLMVVASAWIFDLALSAVLNAGRFDLGFYVGRIYGLLAATFVLLMLLLETGALYAKLARLLATEQRERKREANLAEEKFRLAVEASPSGLVMIDAKGSIVLINVETERLFGYKRHELIGQPVDILVPLRLRGQHEQYRSAFTARPETRRMGIGRELYGLRKDGTEFPVEIGLNPIHTERGLLVLSVIVDISERKRAEAAIRDYVEREQLFIAAVESSNDAIVTKTLDGVITGWNEAAERLFGYTAQEAIGKRIDIVVPDELRDEVRGILAKIKSGEKVENHETTRVTKDRHRIDVSLSVSPIKSQSGTIIGAAKVARDISAAKKAQEALLESEHMARAIIDTALDAFLQMDDSGTIIGWSPKAEMMFGWSSQEIVGQNLRDLIIPVVSRAAYSERIVQFLRDADNGIVGKRYVAPSLRRDGSEIKTEVSLIALRRRGGYVINGFIRDITDKVAAEEQLKQAQKMEAVGQLTGGIAHDFNNMLAVITGTIDILADAVADKPDLAAIAKLISEAADRGAELTGHLLAFARKQPLQPREIDVSALMVESGKLMRPALGEHIEMETVLKSGVWRALVDPNQLSSALLNLAINARDAMPNGGKLTLETSNAVLDRSYAEINADVQPGEYVLIAVSDTGDGIPEAIREKIFEPFFTTKGIGKGTGLGLSMVYGLVKQSGGHIKVYSEEGYGTTFKIYLPRAGEQAKAITAPSPDPQIEGGDETILVVEDDPFVRTSAITQLQSLGYKTLSAADATEALAIADGGARFDLLFTDVIMPGKMNGPQLVEEMAKRRWPLKVLFTSGYTENAIIHHGRLDPGILLLAKPYRKLELARMLRIALDAGKALPIRKTEPLKSQAISAMFGSTDPSSENPCIQSAFVLDDDPRIGAVFCKVLEASGVALRQFTSPGPFLTELQESPPDIVFLDLSLGQSDAIEVIRHLESSKYKGKLLLISGRDEITLNEITQIGEKRGLAMLPPLKKPFRPADIKQRLSSGATETEHRKVQESQHDSVPPKIVVPLIEALDNNWLELWYQPKVDLKSFSVCGAEGLVRARHPVHGIIEPARLLPPTGDPVYCLLSRFVVQRAMADWDKFARQGLHPLLSVNAPVSVINMPSFIALVRSALPSDPAFPGLIVEVTEDEVINDSAWVREIANQLKLYNVGISIDDFGSASASLSRLNDLPFTEVKIDRSFVLGCSSNQLKHSVCQTVIDLAHRFGATVCAEGVETVEDLRALIAMQCDSVQGYVFASPMPAAEFASLLLSGSFESIKSLLQTPDGRGTSAGAKRLGSA